MKTLFYKTKKKQFQDYKTKLSKIESSILTLTTYSDEQRKTQSIKSDPEIFWFRSQLRENVVQKFRLHFEDTAELVVIIKFRLIKLSEFLAEWHALFPALSPVEIIDYLLIQPFLSLPFQLFRMNMVARQLVRAPRQLVGVQFHRKARLGVVLSSEMQVVELVDVPQIHLLAIEFVLVEVLQKVVYHAHYDGST